MAKTKISEFSATANSNTDINSINIAEGCAPSNINDAIRELMAELKDFQAGTKGDSFNGPVGTTTAAAGAFTTLSASSTVSGTGFSTYLASPPAIGGTAAAAGSFTTLTTSSTVTLNGGTANGVLYLNGSKVATSGSALSWSGSALGIGQASASSSGFSTAPDLLVYNASTANIVAAGDSVSAITSARYIDTTGGGILRAAKYRGTYASPAVVQSGDIGGEVRFEVWGGSNLRRIATVGGVVETYTSDTNISGYLTFNTTPAGSTTPSEKMRLDSTGNLGIGTSSPSFPNGGGLAVYNSSVPRIKLTNSTTGDTSTDGTQLIVSGSDFYIQQRESASIIFQTSGTNDRMTIDSSGNLGLGVTPSAWALSGMPALQIKNASLAGYLNRSYLSANTYHNGTNWIYVASDTAAQYRQENGQHQWLTAASGTAGNAITFTQAMTLDASGNLLVGGTSAPLSASGRGNITINGSSTAIMNLTIGGTNKGYIFHDDSAMEVWNADNSDMKFATNNTERARIDSSGNLLVGTTSSTVWNGSAGTKVVVGGSGNTITSLQSSTTTVDQGAIFEGYATGISSNSAALGSIAFLRSNTSTTALSSYTAFYTNSSGSVAERARIDSSGNFMVGQTSTNRRFAATHNVANYTAEIGNSNGTPYGIYVLYGGAAPNNTGSQFFTAVDTGGTRFDVRSNGGLANYSANNVNLSDRREKTNFAPAGEYLSKICAIPVQTFNYIDQNLEEDAGLTLGVVAQDVQAVAPELVMESNWGTEENPKMRLSIYQTDLQYALMKCIQEQQAIIEQLKADVAALKGA